MSDPSSRTLKSQAGEGRTTACFCGLCDRVLYLEDSDLLFCPVCSSPVARIDLEAEVNLQ